MRNHALGDIIRQAQLEVMEKGVHNVDERILLIALIGWLEERLNGKGKKALTHSAPYALGLGLGVGLGITLSKLLGW